MSNIDFSQMVTLEMAQSLSREETLRRIAEKRWSVETKGVLINGLPVKTDRESQSLITGAVVSCMIDPSYVCNFKTPDGFVQLDAAQVTAIGTAVRTYVQACFNRESELIAAVESGVYSESMLLEGWPE